MRKVLLLLIFLIIFMDINVYTVASEVDIPNIVFTHLNHEDGLSQITINDIIQDTDGYMWIATEDGLNRYNGSEFTIFRYDGDNENSLLSNYIDCIAEDSDGNLWIGTTSGLSKLDKITGTIKNYTSETHNLSNNYINDIYMDNNNRVIVSTENGINIFNKEKDDFEVLTSGASQLLPPNIKMVRQDSNGVFWIVSEDGLHSFNNATSEIMEYSNKLEEINSRYFENINDIFIDKSFIWVSSLTEGLTRVNINSGEVRNYRNNGDEGDLPSNSVRYVFRDSKNKLWVGTENGLALFDETNGEFINFTSKGNDETTLIYNSVKKIYQDKQGAIWIGTNRGISLFNANNIFKIYKNEPLNSDSINDDMIFGIYEDNGGLLWLGTVNGGVNILDRKKNKAYKLKDYEWMDESLNISAIQDIDGRDDEIWIAGTYELLYINKKSKEVKKFFKDSNIELLNIFIDSKGFVWIGTGNGLYSIDKNFNVKDYREEFSENSIKGNYINKVYEDSKGIYWIGLGVNGGLIKYNRESGEMKRYSNKENNSTSLSFNSVRDIKEDNNGELWIATNYGLNKFNSKEDNFTRYFEVNGLANDFTYEILVDEDNYLWISTNNGISRFDSEKEEFINFSKNDGLQHNEFNSNSAFKSKSGEMFFGGIAGINSFYPKEFKGDEEELDIPLKIEKVIIDGENKKVKDTITLSYDEKNLEVEYFLAEYISPKRIKYAHKLEGLDDKWIVTGSADDIRYTNIEPGEYKLSITAKTTKGKWLKPIEIKIIKKQAPWKSTGAYLAYISIATIIIFLIWNRIKILNSLISIRTEQLNKKIKENEILHKKAIDNEIKKKNYIVNLSHELRTPLNVIASIEQLITDLNKNEDNIEKSKMSHYMSILKRNSNRLLKLINDIIDTSKIEASEYKLMIQEHDIIYEVEEIVFSMKEYIESKGITLIVDPKMEEKIIQCDMEAIEKCVINILGNAAKFTHSGGIIEVNIEEVDNKVLIKVKDSGIGIESKDLETIFDRFGQTYNKKSEEYGGSGIGLFLSKQLIELHHGELRVESVIGKGSEFIIVLPIYQNEIV